MKKLMVAAVVAMAFCAFAEENKAEEAELVQNDAPIIWGFANYGFYSGYQLYGSIVNTDPTLQGYAELNGNLKFDDLDLGAFGGGIWSNTDLTGRRNASYRRAFNEFDFNVHWQRMFWLDDDCTWGIFYRTSVVWYYYPRVGGRKPINRITMDWDHYFELANPYLIPYLNVVHEYRRSDGDLLQFGVKKPFQITDEFSICPFVEFVWRNYNYGWCFTNSGFDPTDGHLQAAGLATMKLELDATYMFTKNFGVFAKVAYCQNLDDNLRDAASYIGTHGNGAEYGRWNEFCWGGVGLTLSF